jgi:hypothetical protein
MQETDHLIDELNKISQKPSGKQALRFFLNTLGGVPIVGGAIAGVGSTWGEIEQQEFNEKVVEWASKSEERIKSIISALDEQLEAHTKTHMSLLIGEITGLDISRASAETHIPVILNEGTISDLHDYIPKGWISLLPNGSSMNLGSGNRIGNLIEDKKRPWGTGHGFTLTILEMFFNDTAD